jgi:hypothetical protein
LALIAHFLGAPKFLENQATSFTFFGTDLVISTLWTFHFTLLLDHAFISPTLSPTGLTGTTTFCKGNSPCLIASNLGFPDACGGQ